MSEPMCKACRFWKDDGIQHSDGVAIGTCRIRAPSVMRGQVIDDDKEEFRFSGMFPEMQWDDWCGEHQGKHADCDDGLFLQTLPVSTRCQNALEKNGIKTLYELSSRRRRDIKRIRNLGPSCLRELDGLLSGHGLSWQSDPRDGK